MNSSTKISPVLLINSKINLLYVMFYYLKHMGLMLVHVTYFIHVSSTPFPLSYQNVWIYEKHLSYEACTTVARTKQGWKHIFWNKYQVYFLLNKAWLYSWYLISFLISYDWEISDFLIWNIDNSLWWVLCLSFHSTGNFAVTRQYWEKV